MFNPEMMKKYLRSARRFKPCRRNLPRQRLSVRPRRVASRPVSGTQVPVSVTVSDDVCSSGADAVSAELTNALKSAHAKSGTLRTSWRRLRRVGLSAGMAGMVRSRSRRSVSCESPRCGCRVGVLLPYRLCVRTVPALQYGCPIGMRHE